ncbi:MAG: FAD-dependent oxidoreductase [Parcubacteria group bacterium]|nr:FAD-dependent oxidoreductase [Parcubacteria group bacterium]
MSREGINNKESIFSFEDPAFYEKRDLGGVEVSFPKGEALSHLFAGRGFSPEGKAFADKFFKEVTHEAPKEDQASLFEVVHSLLSDEGEEGALKKLLQQSAKLRFKPLESYRVPAEEKREASFDDPASYEKKNLGGVEVTLPKEGALEQLFSGKRFSAEGRQFAKHFFGEVMREIPEGFDIQDIQGFFETVCDQLPQGGKEGLLRKFLYQSAKFRLEHVEKTKCIEELQASNSPLAGLLGTLQTRYEKIPAQFSRNFIASSVANSKKLLNKLTSEMVREDGTVLSGGIGKGVLSAFLENKFSQALKKELESSLTASLKEVMSKTMASFDTSSLREEFRGQIASVSNLRSVEDAIVSSRALSNNRTTIVFEEPIVVVEHEEVLEEQGDTEVIARDTEEVVDLAPNPSKEEAGSEKAEEKKDEPEVLDEVAHQEQVPLSQIILDSNGIPGVRQETIVLPPPVFGEDLGKIRMLRTLGTEYYRRALHALRRLVSGSNDESDRRDLDKDVAWESNNLRWKQEYLEQLLRETLKNDFDEDLVSLRDMRGRDRKEYERALEMYGRAMEDNSVRDVVCTEWQTEDIQRFLQILKSEDEAIGQEEQRNENVSGILNHEEVDASSLLEGAVSERRPEVLPKKGWLGKFRTKAALAGLSALLVLGSYVPGFQKPQGNPMPVGDRTVVTETLTPRVEAAVDPRQILKGIEAPIENEVVISKDQLLRLEHEGLLTLKSGTILYTEDIVRYLDQLTRQLSSKQLTPETTQRFVDTYRLLKSGKILNPQAVKFQIVEENNQISLRPVDFVGPLAVKEKLSTDVLVVGGELESVEIAVASAKKGKNVTVLYSGALGGLSSEEGGNMRYFDRVDQATVTPAMQEIFDVLGMKGDARFMIPDNVSGRLTELMHRYPNIHIVSTETLASMYVVKEDDRIKTVTTGEGVEITPGAVVESSPDGVFAEKAGVPFTVDTLNISYGAIFDADGIRQEDLKKLSQMSPSSVLGLAGVTEQELAAHPELLKEYQELLKIPSGANTVGTHASWGYRSFGNCFNFYLKVLALKNPGDTLLQEGNARRIVDGFNVATRESGNGWKATFNSLSYNSDKSYHQGDHNLREDNDLLSQIARSDLARMQEFLRNVTGNSGINVVVPKEVYVRQAGKNFQTPEMLTVEKRTVSSGTSQFRYPDDARGIGERFPNDVVSGSHFGVLDELHGDKPINWHVSAQHTRAGTNFYIVSKGGGVEPILTPMYRIVHNLMLVGDEVVAHIDDEGYWKTSIKGGQLPSEHKSIDTARNAISYGDPTSPSRVYMSVVPNRDNVGNKEMGARIVIVDTNNFDAVVYQA